MNFEQHLDSLIPFLANLKLDPSAEVLCDLMCDGLVGTDEKVFEGLTAEQMGCMRAIFRYRTSMINGVPDTRFEHLWALLKLRCPLWIGFDLSRSTPSESLRQIYRDSKWSKRPKSGN